MPRSRTFLSVTSDRTQPQLPRLTGLLYILYFIAGSPLLVRSSLVVPGNAVATAGKIVASEALYRVTIVTDLVSYVLYLGLAYLFYLLLREVRPRWALLGAVFTAAGCIVLITVTTFLTAPLALLTGDLARTIPVPERQELALLALRLYQQGFVIALFLFGVQWLIMGPLFARSRFVPTAIGYLLTAGGIGWVSFAIASLVAPAVGLAMQPIALILGSLGEIALALWLLIRGATMQGENVSFAEASSE